MAAKKKILHVTSVHPRYDIRIFVKECRSLEDADYSVTLLVADGFGDEITNEGLRIRDVGKGKEGRLYRMTKLLLLIKKVLDKNDFEILHFHDPELLPLLFFFRLKRKTVIYDMHENLPKQILSKSWIHPFLRRILSLVLKIAEKLLLKNTPVIFAEDSYRKDYLWVKYMAVVRNMPILEILERIRRENKDNKDEIFSLGYVGGITAERGSFLMLDFVHDLARSGYAIKLKLVGPVSESHKKQLEKRIEGYGLENVELSGYRKAEEAYRIIAGCHVGLALLKPIPNYLESYPTKIFEYMALKLPVIVSDFPINKEVVEKTGSGFAVNPTDKKEILEKITELIKNPALRNRMGENGYDAIKRSYSWEKEKEKLFDFYRNII